MGLILALMAIATLLPLWLGARVGLLPLVSPLHLLAAFAALGGLVKAMAWIVAPDLAVWPAHVARPEAALAGALYYTGFVLAICLGYLLAMAPGQAGGAGASPLRAALAGRMRYGRALFWGSVAVALAVALTLAALRGIGDPLAFLRAASEAKQVAPNAQGVGSTFAGLKMLFILPKLAFVLCLAQALSGGPDAARARGRSALLGLLLLAVAAVSGDRFELVELAAYALITHVLIRGRPRPGTFGRWIPVAAALLALATLMTLWRSGGGEGASLWRQVLGSTYFLDLNVAIIAVERAAPELRLGGESYLWWSFGWVPRLVWPDKPATDLGVYFKAVVMGLPQGGAINVTGPGEAFVNFGWAGMAVGGVLGAVFRRIEEALLAPRAALRHGAFVFYPLIFYPFVQASLQSSISAFLVAAAVQGPLCWAVLALVLPRYRVVPATAGTTQGRARHAA